jgi:hypothetical protein
MVTHFFGMPFGVVSWDAALTRVCRLEALGDQELDQQARDRNVVIYNQDLASARVTRIRGGYFFSAGNRVSIG